MSPLAFFGSAEVYLRRVDDGGGWFGLLAFDGSSGAGRWYVLPTEPGQSLIKCSRFDEACGQSGLYRWQDVRKIASVLDREMRKIFK